MKDIINQKQVLSIAGAYDGLSAKIAEEAGFDAIWCSGFCISASFGLPDMSILTMTDMLERAIMIRDVTSLPIIADCDSGFGDINNAVRATRLYCKNGIESICIEDKLFPKRNSYMNAKHDLRPAEEFVSIIKACKDVGSAFNDFFFLARLEGLVSNCEMQEVVDRAHAYCEAGADGLFIQSKYKDPTEIDEFIRRAKLNTPLFITPTMYPQINIGQVKKMGIKGVIYANQGMRAAVKASMKVMKQILLDQTAFNVEDELVSMKEIFHLQNSKSYVLSSK